MIAGLVLAGLAAVAALGVTVLAVMLHRTMASQAVNAVHSHMHN
jgi:hypothetical protein